jgi:ornithine cyclodeaminase/alanine dehydrogenase-like protein (mu-crystallin family)
LIKGSVVTTDPWHAEVEGLSKSVDKGGGIRLLTQAEVRRLMNIESLIGALERAFISLSSGAANVPPRATAVKPDGSFLAAMPGYVEDTLVAKLVSIFPRNHERGTPAVQAIIMLFDQDTGTPLALMDGTYITAIRTGASSALAARTLAREDAKTLAVLGAGVQGRSHLETVPRVRNFKEIRLASRNRAHAERLAEDFPAVTVADSFEDAVRGADVVCACTDAAGPVVLRRWLKPGAHVSSVGFGKGPELDAETVRSGRLFVESRNAFRPYPAGAHELQGLDPEQATELGEVLVRNQLGRQTDDEITIYKSTGHAVEDAVAARVVYDAATKTGIGTLVTV